VNPTTEEPQIKSGPKDDPKPDSNGKPKAGEKADLKPDAIPKSKDDLKSIPISDLQAKLQASPKGRTQAEATKRLTHDGPNALKVEKSNAFLKIGTRQPCGREAGNHHDPSSGGRQFNWRH
jgi:H+-transporting ATPase